MSWDYAAGGELAGFQHFVAEGAGAWYLPLRFELAEVEDSIQAPLTPQWVEVPGSGAASATWRDSVVYDGWERVRSVRQALNGGHYPSYTRTYGFDRAGNVTTPLGQESYAAATARLQARRSEVDTTVQYGYTYDAAGNLTGRTQVQAGDTTNWAYGWDALDRLVSIRRNDTLIARYGYDVQGRRIAKRVYDAASGGTVGYTRFVYTGNHVAWEADSAGTAGRRYLWGVGTDHLIGFREADGTRYVVATDKLGSVRALIRQADGVWTGGMRFDPYGTQVDSAGSLLALRYRWTGREWDGETGFYFHRARYYDPGAKRFISEDPIGYAGGENLYAYVGGAVLEARDPSGLVNAVPYTVGFAAFCTTMGSCMDWTGAVTPGSYSAAEELLAWGGAGETRFRILQAWKQYKKSYEALKTKYDAMSGSFMSDDYRIKYQDLFGGSAHLSQIQFNQIIAAFVGADGGKGDLGEDILASLSLGTVFFNDRFHRRYSGATSSYGWTLTVFVGGVGQETLHILRTGAATVNLPWAVGHEVLHRYSEFQALGSQAECAIEGRMHEYFPNSRSPGGFCR
jgi:RHS repeat-associated protein